MAFGVDIETGGHVFQLVLTNTRGLTERAWLTETTGDFFKGDIHLGFNITRTFQLAKRKVILYLLELFNQSIRIAPLRYHYLSRPYDCDRLLGF